MNYESPNTYYSKFFAKFNEIDTLEISKWEKSHLIGYFCKKYYNEYKTLYSFKFNTPQPSKSFEIFQITKLYIGLTSNTEILKSYIDWIFETKVKKAKRKLTSISFLTNDSDVYLFKQKYLSGDSVSIDRTTSLPISARLTPEINTYGDLAFFMAVDNDESRALKEKLIEINFDFDKLSKVK